MALEIKPYTADQVPAARAFNKRMRQGNAPSEFLLGESAPDPQKQIARRIRTTNYLAVDDSFVGGGFMLIDFPARLSGQEITATDWMAPLSEGIVDPRHSMVGMQFIKYPQKNVKYGMAVGMGGIANPFPRLLKAAGWTVYEVPFFFRVIRASRFFREMGVFNSSPARRVAGRIAAVSGLGAVAVTAMHARGLPSSLKASGLTVDNPPEWGNWADEIWQTFRVSCSFAIERDSATLAELHPFNQSRLVRLRLRRGERTVGWAAAMLTPKKNDKYFGNLTVATILDCVSGFDEMPAAIQAVTRALARSGADLVIANQTHARCQESFRQAGYLAGPSNYCLAISKPIAEGVRSGLGESAIYVTRADGDGRIHL